ncbi:hypothetical protein GCM10018987_19680 [Streptomyces cremeus]
MRASATIQARADTFFAGTAREEVAGTVVDDADAVSNPVCADRSSSAAPPTTARLTNRQDAGGASEVTVIQPR